MRNFIYLLLLFTSILLSCNNRAKGTDNSDSIKSQNEEFPDGMATLEDCEIDETEPDASKPDDTIISIVSPGYRRNGRLIRLAKVVVVKN